LLPGETNILGRSVSEWLLYALTGLAGPLKRQLSAALC
jgi:hypothetical protein